MLLNERSADRLTRRQVLRTGAAASFAVLGGGALSALDVRRVAAAPAGGTTLRVAMLLNIHTLDPGRTLENATNNIDHVTYDAPVTFEGEDLKTIRPSLATRWTMSPDGLTYTFTLRPNVKFA